MEDRKKKLIYCRWFLKEIQPFQRNRSRVIGRDGRRELFTVWKEKKKRKWLKKEGRRKRKA